MGLLRLKSSVSDSSSSVEMGVTWKLHGVHLERANVYQKASFLLFFDGDF